MRNLIKWGLILSGIGLVLCIGLVALGGLLSDDLPDTQVEEGAPAEQVESVEEEPTEAPTAVPVVQVDLDEVIEAYQDNEIRAERDYGGSPVEFDAYVYNINENIFGGLDVFLSPTAPDAYFGTTVNCSGLDEDVVIELSKGDEVTVVADLGDAITGILIETESCELK